MSVESFDPIPVEVFGSLVTLVDPSDVPIGLSPDCADVEFFPGGVRTRPGLSSVFTAIGGNPKVNGLSNFININLTGKLLVFTSAGELYKESTPGTLSLVASGLPLTAYMKSTTLFGREYMAFSDGKVGLQPSQQFDDTTFGRVSQVGPSEGPDVADEEVPNGPNSPITVVNVAGADVDWVNPGNAVSSNDAYAVADPVGAGLKTDPLRATNFNFTLPEGEVTGVKVEVESYEATGSNPGVNFILQLVKNGSLIGAQRTVIQVVGGLGLDTYFSFGGDGDTWGAALTTTDSADSTFGVQVVLQNPTGGALGFNIDHIRMTIFTGPVQGNGPNSPQVGAHILGAGVDWINAGDLISSNDVYASATLNDAQETDYLRATRFGFALPSSGRLVGIKVEVETRRFSGAGTLTVSKISLVRNGEILATEKTPATAITDTEQYLTFGDSSDGWGKCPTADEVNDQTFGVQLTVACAGGAGTVVVIDHIRISVYAVLGEISAGKHKMIMWYFTDSGYETRPSPPVEWTAKGNRRVSITNTPFSNGNAAPANAKELRFAFSPVDSSSFFHIPETMTVKEPLAAAAFLVSFTDAGLLSGRPVDRLLRRVELPQCAGVTKYAGARRLVWWGERPKMSGWRNLSFDAGHRQEVSGQRPYGWTMGTDFGASFLVTESFGFSYRVTGNGASAVLGDIRQQALTDPWDSTSRTPLIERGRAYTVRCRAKRNATLVAGRLNIDLFGTGVDTTGLQVTAATLTESLVEYSAELTAALSTLPSDLVLRVFVDQTPTNFGQVFVDEIEIFPSDEPSRGSVVRVSDTEDPESYDGINGLMIVAENDGQAVRNAFELRDILYLVKERSLHATADDGFNEPSGWRIELASSKIGTPSPQGVGLGEDWAVIAGRAGLYLFAGGAPQKISQEIQPTWDRINWEHGHKLWVKVDVEAKRILVAVPLDSATEPNTILYLDYVQGFGDPLEGEGYGRKWTIWNISANSAEIVERSTGKARVFLGNNAANGKVYELLSTQLSDDGVAINSYYRTAFLSRSKGMGRQLFGYLTSDVGGVGTLTITAYKPGDVAVSITPSWKLTDPSTKHMERMIRGKAEEISFRVGTNAVGSWFSMAKIVAWAKPAPWAFHRGRN